MQIERKTIKKSGQCGALLVVLVGLVSVSSVYGAPDCLVRPDHPSCGGAGDGDAAYAVFLSDFHGSVQGDFESKETKITNTMTTLVFNKTGGGYITFSETFAGLDVFGGRDGTECFGPLVDSAGVSRTRQWEASHHLFDATGNDADMVMRIWFRGENDPVDPAEKVEISYVMELFQMPNVVVDWVGGSFPPLDTDPVTRTATHFLMRTTSKGYLRNEPCVTGSAVYELPEPVVIYVSRAE